MHHATIFTRLQSRMTSAFVGQVPALDIGDEFRVPLIFVSRSKWLANIANSDNDTVIAGYTATAAHHSSRHHRAVPIVTGKR